MSEPIKHLLKLADLSTEQILDILNLADQLKYERKHGIPHPLLAGKTRRQAERELEREFFRFLVRDGLHVRIESNR